MSSVLKYLHLLLLHRGGGEGTFKISVNNLTYNSENKKMISILVNGSNGGSVIIGSSVFLTKTERLSDEI